ncbi:MAG: hypothetical protein D6767_05725 [Candidatus Hydrogenedentota bacterium]|nr:MAG: hypothetical protein D6767_05725 [Candidatus Hydrogenedentota bacterium]
MYQGVYLLRNIVEEEKKAKRKVHLLFGASRLAGILGHLQAVRFCEQAQVSFDSVYGSQIGSVPAAMFSCGVSYRKLWYYLIHQLNSKEIFDFRYRDILTKTLTFNPLHLDGVCYGKNVRHALQILFQEQTKKPENLTIFAEYLDSNRLKKFKPPKEIPILDAISAATAITALYPPYQYGKQTYVDSGVLGGLPLREIIQEQGIKKRGLKKHTIIAFQEAFTSHYEKLSLAERLVYSFVEKVRYHSALLDIEFAKQSGVRLILISFYAGDLKKSLVSMTPKEKFSLLDAYSMDITEQLRHYTNYIQQKKWPYEKLTPLARS